MTDYTKDIDRRTAERAFSGTSFDPEKRADAVIRDYNIMLNEDQEYLDSIGAGSEFDRYHDKFKSLYLAWLYARSNCISTMITGPANFPVRRAEKANNSERNKWQDFILFREKAKKAIYKKLNPFSGGVISADDPSALEKISNKIANLERDQVQMVSINKAWREYAKTGNNSALLKIGFSEEAIIKIQAEIDRAYSWEKQPYPGYMLSNRSAEIRRLKGRLSQLERAENITTSEREENGVRIVENTEENRLQLFFPGKPNEEIRSKLKSRGFKWSPRNGCWQRQLTENARYTVKEMAFSK